MQPIVYFFGTHQNTNVCYPQDHTKHMFADFLKKSVNICQLIVHRSDNLLYYGYVRTLGKNDKFGICLCIDKIYDNPVYLMEIFDDLFATMTQNGEIIKIASGNNVEWVTSDYSKESVSVIEYSKKLKENVDVESNSVALPPTDYSISINECICLSLEDGPHTIIDATKRYSNLYVVKKKSYIERITSFHKQLEQKENTIATLKKENSDLIALNGKIKKQKKQFKNVVFLILVVIGCGVGLFFLHDSLTDTRDELSSARDTIVERNATISKNKSTIKQKEEEIKELSTSLQNEKAKNEKLTQKLSNLIHQYPIAISKIEVNSDELSFDYDSKEEKELTFTLKAINERNGNIISNSHTLTYYADGGHKSLRFSSKLNPSDYYYVILMYDGKIIAGKRW